VTLDARTAVVVGEAADFRAQAAISRIRSRSICRSSVPTKIAATEAVTSESTASPFSTSTTAKTRDSCVLGTMSP
jgi:hypothetical protein